MWIKKTKRKLIILFFHFAAKKKDKGEVPKSAIIFKKCETV